MKKIPNSRVKNSAIFFAPIVPWGPCFYVPVLGDDSGQVVAGWLDMAVDGDLVSGGQSRLLPQLLDAVDHLPGHALVQHGLVWSRVQEDQYVLTAVSLEPRHVFLHLKNEQPFDEVMVQI